jgi:hypothetical protein
MAAQAEIQEWIDQGDYHQALGIPQSASRIETDIAAERINASCPEIAGMISNITQVLTNEQHHEIYMIACALRDRAIQVMEERHGSDIRKMIYLRQRVWLFCQRVLNCEFTKNQVKIQRATAESIAEEGIDWVIEDSLNTLLPVVKIPEGGSPYGQHFYPFEQNSCSKCGTRRWVACDACGGSGYIQQEEDKEGEDEGKIFILLDDVPPPPIEIEQEKCPQCQGSGRMNCDCFDQFLFRIPESLAPGSIIRGMGQRTGKYQYAIFDHQVVTPRPIGALASMYMMSNSSAMANIIEQYPDAAITMGDMHKSFQGITLVGPILGLIFCLLLGRWLGSWITGILTGAAWGILAVITINIQQVSPRSYRGFIMMLSPLVIGPLIGYLFGSWLSGLIIGGIFSGAQTVLYLISLIYLRKISQ